MMLDHSDRISAPIAALDARIQEAIGPFSRPANDEEQHKPVARLRRLSSRLAGGLRPG
jgi:hypothetical protein